MIVQIIPKGEYDFLNYDDITLKDGGCGCCSQHYEATRPNIIAAIEHHRKFIQELEELLREIECQPSQP